MLDLKNCPFCGGKAELSVRGMTAVSRATDLKYYAVVNCPSCEASVCGEATDDEDEAQPLAIAAWNRRALQAVGPEPAVMRTGDHVYHAPSDETWVVAWADQKTGYMSPCGWPECQAKISDCTITKRATDDESNSLVEQLSKSGRRDADNASRIRSALVATPPAEQHPDDIAVDCFAAAMKAKLKWEREHRNRSGWQAMSAADLSRILYEHLPKGDPVDVANLSMMLHQNGQQIETPPAETVEEEWREIEQHVQPRLADGYTAVAISKPGFWMVKGPGPAAALAAKPAVKDDETVVEAPPDDLFTHKDAWRVALVEMRNTSEVSSPDIDDQAYWQHELDVFDRVFAALAAKDGR